MPRKPRKTRIPLGPELSDQILFESDTTCCVCRTPGRPVQIHHIDDDPSNNEQANLAVLCFDCHDKTQVQGGFGRTITPGVVTKYRDDWVQTVKDKRAKQRGHEPPPPAKRTIPRMTPEQSRQLAKRLRELYKPFLEGVGYMRDYAAGMAAPLENETVEARQQRLRPTWDRGAALVKGVLSDIKVEPGSGDVCDNYNTFYNRARACMRTPHSPSAQKGFMAVLGEYHRSTLKREMDEAIGWVEDAVRAHIKRVDAHT